MKIIVKLTVGFLIVALLVLIAGYFSSSRSQKILQETIGENAIALAREALDKIDRNIYNRIELFQDHVKHAIMQSSLLESNEDFEKLDNMQEYISEQDEKWTSVPKETIMPFMQDLIDNELSVELRELMEFYKEKYGYYVFAEAFVTNKYGANVSQTAKTSDYRQDDEEWWQEARDKGLYVSDVQYDESAGVYSTDIGIRVDDKNGNFIGAMKIVLSIEEVINILESIASTEKYKSRYFKLLNKDGKLIHITKKESEVKFWQDVSKEEYVKRIKGDRGYFINTESGEEEVLFAFARSKGFKDFRGLGWILIVEHEAGDIFAPVFRLRKNLLIGSFIITFFTILIGGIISHSILKPIRKLMQATIKIGKGNLDTKVEIKSKDEIGTLAMSFNKMTEDLLRTTTSIDILDKEIAKRKANEIEILRNHEIENVINRMLNISLEKISLENMLEKTIDCLVSVNWLKLIPRGAIFLVEDKPDVLVLKAQRKFSPALLKMCKQVPFNKCLCGKAAASKKIVFASSVDERHEHSCKGISEHGHYCIPILSSGNNVLGVFNLYIQEGHKRDKKEEDFLNSVSHVLAGIIERKKVEKDLETLKHQLEYILGVTKTGLDIIDSDFNVRYIDPEWQKVYGDPAGKKCYEYFMGRHLVCPNCGIIKALKIKQRVVTEEILVKENNRPIQVTTIPFQDDKGNWLVAEVNVDITERKKAEEELKKAYKELKEMQEQLIQAEKMAALGTLSAGMAHEINNPLMGTMLLTETLLSEKKKGAKGYKTLSQIVGGLRRISNVVSKLLVFSRKEKIILNTEDINAIVEATIPLIEHEYRSKQVELAKDFEENLPSVQVGKNSIQQVLVNILLNAKDAVLNSKSKKVAISTYLEDNLVKIKVKDEGCGIKKENLKKIFDPFFTTKPAGKGLGMGMSIVRNIIEQHNGKIDIISEENKGAKVIISLPIQT